MNIDPRSFPAFELAASALRDADDGDSFTLTLPRPLAVRSAARAGMSGSIRVVASPDAGVVLPAPSLQAAAVTLTFN